MKTRTPKHSILVCTLMGIMVAGLAQGATTLRYIGSGDYKDLYSVTGVNGWSPDGSGPGGLPGSDNSIRFNYGNNTVTLTNVVPDVFQFLMGVDESGQLVVGSGGRLRAIGTSSNKVGNNGGAGVVGGLTVQTNGEVDSTAVLYVGGAATGFVVVDGGTLNASNHLWVGGTSGSVGGITGTIILTNGGVLNMLGVGGNGMLGLGTYNATSASGSFGILKVTDGSVLNLFNLDGQGRSIQPGSVLDITGSGVVTIPGDRTTVLNTYYISAGKITAYGGTGAVAIDYNTSNPGKTTLKAVGGYVPPTDVVWDPAANPAGHGLWNEGANWTGGLVPASVTKVTFNTVGATSCTVTNMASCSYLDMGDNGPGGTLIVTNGGILNVDSGDISVIGNNSNALLVVENGGTVTFGTNLAIGLNFDADGRLQMNGGTVSVAGMFTLGYLGGKGTAQVKGGTLNLSQWDDFYGIQGASVLDVCGTGKVVLNGDHAFYVDLYIELNQITNSDGTGLKVDYNIINVGKTTIYPAGLNLAPAQAVWNPALNLGDTYGLWNMNTNWSTPGGVSLGMCPGATTVVTFNVPDAIPCTVTNAALAGYVAMGNSGGPGGTLIVTNGGSLTTGGDNWSAVAYGSNALMLVEKGGVATFGYHLWVGFDPGADGTLIIDGGTVEVWGMFGLGWNGGKGSVIVTNGGNLILHQWHPTDSIKGPSVLNLTGTGTVVITGNYASSISNFVSNGKITANGANLAYSFDTGANTTTLQVAPPRQPVTSVNVSGGNTTLTFQTTPGHIYHVEGTPSMSPAAWTRVAGSTTNATGAAVTFSFPTNGVQMFYRAVSP